MDSVQYVGAGKEETKKAIVAAKAKLNLGQHWTLKADHEDMLPIYPTDILILSTSDFSFGGVVSLCLAPSKLEGRHFPARADIILDYYKLVYDPYEKEAV